MTQFKITGTVRTSGFGHLREAYSILYEALMESGAKTNHITRESSGLCSTVVNFSVEGTEEQINIFRRLAPLSQFTLSPVAGPDPTTSSDDRQSANPAIVVDPQIRATDST
jgi:hypothetical protein